MSRRLKYRLKHMAFQYLVSSHPVISREYARLQDEELSPQAKLKRLIFLNWKYRILKKAEDEPLAGLCMPEGRHTKLPSETELADLLSEADTVVFDVFGTLIFRAVEKQEDVYRLLEGQRSHFGFAALRKRAQKKLQVSETRKKKIKKITLSAIYGELAEAAVDPQKGICQELEMEKKVCYANPYMHAVCLKLTEKGIRMAAVSNGYYGGWCGSKRQLRMLLDACGYAQVRDIYLSCTLDKTQERRQLRECLNKDGAAADPYIYVGNRFGKHARGCFYYPDIQKEGAPYRRKEMTSLAASFYKGLVNAKLHAGSDCVSAYYEYGYVYGGILAAGFCQYINRNVTQDGTQLVLFAARDGFLPYQLCRKYFPQIQGAYFACSRFAACQITMERNWRRFLESAVRPRMYLKKKENLGQVLKMCGMEWMRQYFGAYGLSADLPFEQSVYDQMQKIFSEQIHSIMPFYKEQEKAAEIYFRKLMKNNKKICVADIGWQGTSIADLKYFLEQKCGMDVHISGILLGMKNNETAGISLDTGLMKSYLFSPGMNHENMLRHEGRQINNDFRNLLIEILFTQDAPSFLHYGLDAQGQVQLVYGRKEHNGRMIREIQKGICDFCSDYLHYAQKFDGWLEVNGQEAYIPLDALAQNEKYCLKLFQNYEIHKVPGDFEASQHENLAEAVL